MDQPEVAPYYTNLRIVVSTLASVLLVLYSVQIYLDRNAIPLLLPGRASGRARTTKSLARLGGFIYIFVITIASVDQVGAFGIYGIGFIAFKNIFLSSIIGGVLGFAFWKALFAAFPFIIGQNMRRRKQVTVGWTVFMVNVVFAVTVREMITQIGFKIFIDIFIILIVNIFAAVVIVTYVALKRHQKFLEVTNKQCGRDSSDFRKLLKQVRRWRRFSLLVLLVEIAVIASQAIELVADIESLRSGEPPKTVNGFFLVDDPSISPAGAPFDRVSIETGTAFVLASACLWYTWIWKTTDPKVILQSSHSSNDGSTASNMKSLNSMDSSKRLESSSEYASTSTACKLMTHQAIDIEQETSV